MKIRDSGMPEESNWESLLNVPLILSKFDIKQFHDVVDIGCGYGTFSIPIAQTIRGTLYAFDIDPTMIERIRERGVGLHIIAQVRNVMRHGCSVKADAVLLFNILHCEEPVGLLHHARVALRDGGQVLVIHWRHDIVTPRGPKADIRPSPQRIAAWALQAGFKAGEAIDLPPWHYGMSLTVN